MRMELLALVWSKTTYTKQASKQLIKKLVETSHAPNKRLLVKRHRGEPGHTRDTRDTRPHKGTQTNLTTNQTHQQHTPYYV